MYILPSYVTHWQADSCLTHNSILRIHVFPVLLLLHQHIKTPVLTPPSQININPDVRSDIAMEPGPSWFQACACGWTFSLLQAYSCHKNSCHTSKKCFSDDIQRAKEALQAWKQQKLDSQTAIASMEMEMDLPAPIESTQTLVRHFLSHDFT